MSSEYTPAGVVHRGSTVAECVCGGQAWVYWDGGLFKHSNPYYPHLDHEAIKGTGGYR